MDVGGTTLRTARYLTASGDLRSPRRVPTESLALHPDLPAVALQHRVVEQIAAQAEQAVHDGDATAVGIAFAGPIAATGEVLAAPTIWGAGGDRINLSGLLEERLGVRVMVVNDLTAAVWRYVRGPDEPPFCLITVSSGIGNKVYWGGQVLLDPGGHGGELGHWTCRLGPAAPRCDCGGRGHLGALASGRGVLAAARSAASAFPAEYRTSALGRMVPNPADLNNTTLSEAICAGDLFATKVLTRSLRPLAEAITSVFCAIGVRRFRVIGGFAQSIGTRYAQLLTETLYEIGCFGLPSSDIDQMIVMGEPDDDHGLIGVGRLLTLKAGDGAT